MPKDRASRKIVYFSSPPRWSSDCSTTSTITINDGYFGSEAVQVKDIIELAAVAKESAREPEPGYFSIAEKSDLRVGPKTVSLSYYPRNQTPGNYQNVNFRLSVSYMNVRDLLARFFLTTFYNLGKKDNWREWCIGVDSVITDESGLPTLKHIPMFDYDGKNVRKCIRSDVKNLQKNYGLGDAWVFGTKRGYHIYFLCDTVPREEYLKMLETTQCCKGFRQASKNRGHSTLRISAKFTAFDIKFLYILHARKRSCKRIGPQGHIILALIDLGTQCGTHLASMFPKQAIFTEDAEEWKPPAPGKPEVKTPTKAVPKNLPKTKNLRKIGEGASLDQEILGSDISWRSEFERKVVELKPVPVPTWSTFPNKPYISELEEEYYKRKQERHREKREAFIRESTNYHAKKKLDK